MKLGKTILKPVGDNQRYDLVVDEGDKFNRVQIKTGHFKNGTISANACRQPVGKSKRIQYTKNEIDSFIIYCIDNDEIYWIPIEDVNVIAEFCLRIDPPKNNQTKNIKWAKNYLVT